jgi:hypothetical protein
MEIGKDFKKLEGQIQTEMDFLKKTLTLISLKFLKFNN